MIVIIDRLDEPHVINGSAERMKQIIWPIFDNKFLKSPGLGFKMLLPNELYRFIEREDESFNQRARLDKQNLIPSLEWSGETLYDIASMRLKAASVKEPPTTLAELFEPEVNQTRLIDGKAKHSPTNDWDTNAVWVDARRAMTVTQERHTEPQDKTLSQRGCHTS